MDEIKKSIGRILESDQPTLKKDSGKPYSEYASEIKEIQDRITESLFSKLSYPWHYLQDSCSFIYRGNVSKAIYDEILKMSDEGLLDLSGNFPLEFLVVCAEKLTSSSPVNSIPVKSTFSIPVQAEKITFTIPAEYLKGQKNE